MSFPVRSGTTGQPVRRLFRSEILELLVDYEKSHPVESYRIANWCAWPLLRVSMALRAERLDETFNPVERWYRRARAFATRSARYLVGWTNARLSRSSGFDPSSQKAEIVFLTYPNRRLFLGGEWCHPLADPLRRFVSKSGSTCTTWECGRAVRPCDVPSNWISYALYSTARLQPRYVHTCSEMPEWFRNLSIWARSNLHIHLSWREWRINQDLIERLSRVFDRWLDCSGCRTVIVDCWYNFESSALTLAAHRRGLTTIEFQHGLQGFPHPGYSGWTKGWEPGNGVVPGTFWVWGEADADNLSKTNSHPPVTIAGGHLWLNEWRREGRFESEIESARALSRGAGKTILVTTQPVVDLDLVESAVRISPSDWRWLIRVHPRARGQLDVLKRRFSALRARCELEKASGLPLYALLSISDAHVTGFSTCALESLALNTPTIVFHETGKAAFRELIDGRMMSYASTAEQLIDLLTAQPARSEALAGYVERWFAKPDALEPIGDLLARAGR